MNKNQTWKWLLIALLVAIALLNVYPPQDRLKGGLDLVGGTSIIYDIDTTDLSREESKGIAQRMIPILLDRVDPTNVANIVMRPQGDTRIEIQMPMARGDTKEKRDSIRSLIPRVFFARLCFSTYPRDFHRRMNWVTSYCDIY